MSFKETEFGRIYSDCKVFNLDEVYTFSSGLSKSRKEFGFGNPFVTFKDVFYNYFLPENLSELANTNEKEISRCSVKRGDVFLTRTSETSHELGKSSVALKDYPNATFNGFTKRLRPKLDGIIFPEYAGYYFRSNLFRNQINSMVTMTTRASLNNDTMAKLKIVIPKIEEQKAIAKILSDLDEKIEVNNKINKNLEEMAQAIFKQWFVDFEFPNEEGKPYKSSGGEMVESELGMIPKGFKVKEFGDIINITSGKRPKNKSKEYNKETNIPLIGASSVMGFTNDFNFDTNILVIGRVGTHGVVQRFNYKVWASDNTLVIKSNCLEFSNQILKSIDYKSLNRGSTQPLITQGDIKQQKIIFPNVDLLKDFEKRCFKLMNLFENNVLENERLEKLRDTLLPKLMSGEIRVPLENNEN